MSGLGDDLDLPYEDGPPGQMLSDRFRMSGGVVVMASVVQVEGKPCPSLVFRFSDPHGVFYDPILLVLNDDQAAKLPTLVQQATGAALRAAKEAS